MGLVQGVTELFPISSLGQAVVLPTLLGWDDLARAQAQPESFFLAFREAAIIGVAQVLALIAGISRSGITMVAGLVRGLSHEDAARFSFLLATPIILAAGLYKLPDLFGPLGNGIRGQVLAGSVVSGIVAYLSVRFLMRYFETRTLTPFAIFCLLEGIACTIGFAATGHTF